MDGTSSAKLILENGSEFDGVSFGFSRSAAGEVVFNTGMVGYAESLTDPSYRGQILVFTYPLIGNYGIPADKIIDGISSVFESGSVRVDGVVVSGYSANHSHWNSAGSLGEWLIAHEVPAISGVDTRRLTRLLRESGTMPGKILFPGGDIPFRNPNEDNLVEGAGVSEPVVYERSSPRVVLVDCGCKHNILRSLLERDVTVKRVPWNYDFADEPCDGVILSNGPGDPKMCGAAVENVKKAMGHDIPVFGICLGNQILGLAAGGSTYKLKFGHRSQNQPCLEVGGARCHITSQNHGYAVDTRTLPAGWEPWFINANDGTNEGIRHRSRPFMSVQFHPEASPGPVDTGFLFDMFLERLG